MEIRSTARFGPRKGQPGACDARLTFGPRRDSVNFTSERRLLTGAGIAAESRCARPDAGGRMLGASLGTDAVLPPPRPSGTPAVRLLMTSRQAPDEPPWQRARDRRAAQLALRGASAITSPGTGPDTATGWHVGPGRCVRCVICGYVLALDGVTSDTCWCEALATDAVAGRVGSDLGDSFIERVSLAPRPG